MIANTRTQNCSPSLRDKQCLTELTVVCATAGEGSQLTAVWHYPDFSETVRKYKAMSDHGRSNSRTSRHFLTSLLKYGRSAPAKAVMHLLQVQQSNYKEYSETLIVSQPFKKMFAFDGIRIFIIAFTKAKHVNLLRDTHARTHTNTTHTTYIYTCFQPIHIYIYIYIYIWMDWKQVVYELLHS